MKWLVCLRFCLSYVKFLIWFYLYQSWPHFNRKCIDISSVFIIWSCAHQNVMNLVAITLATESSNILWYRERKIQIIFFLSSLNICFGCSIEPSHWDGSIEHPQHMFWLRNKKTNFHLHTFIWRPNDKSAWSQENRILLYVNYKGADQPHFVILASLCSRADRFETLQVEYPEDRFSCDRTQIIIEPRHEISNNVVCATCKASDQPAHMCSLIRAFASHLNFLWLISSWPNIIWSF